MTIAAPAVGMSGHITDIGQFSPPYSGKRPTKVDVAPVAACPRVGALACVDGRKA
ncbi:hypothetical protein ATK30_5200 [Amycolatopsis echigonensis]|uniref:Uncharacterized protein n=1 Tax=Amycolatopsis echigonensis TaxID=2576905 RepID=A0A2N3WKB9_9PSEU|nr:hypothetical protein ATK30_5200 [Amycolatopsis niigatensis]